jgi:hypothetical protein
MTFLGDEEFYLLLLPLLYWASAAGWGLRLGVMLLLTAGVNNVLKLLPAHAAAELPASRRSGR